MKPQPPSSSPNVASDIGDGSPARAKGGLMAVAATARVVGALSARKPDKKGAGKDSDSNNSGGNPNANYPGKGILGIENPIGKYFVELPGGKWMDGTIFPLADLHKTFGSDKVLTYEQMLVARAGGGNGDPHHSNIASCPAAGAGGGQPGGSNSAASKAALFSRLAATASTASVTPRPPAGVAPKGAASFPIGVNPSKSPVPSLSRLPDDDDYEDQLRMVGGHPWSALMLMSLAERQRILMGELLKCRGEPLSISQLSSMRSSSARGVLTPAQISPRLLVLPSLENCQSAKRFVTERLKLLHSDENLQKDFFSKVRCFDVATKIHNQGTVEHSEQYFLEQDAKRSIHHAHYIEMHEHRVEATRQNYKMHWTQRREDLIQLNQAIEARCERAGSNRNFSSMAKPLARQWMVHIALFFSSRKFREGLFVGFRKKWLTLATYLMYYHWKWVVRRRRARIAHLRRNCILRKIIPRWLNIVKIRLQQAHVDRVKHVLKLVSKCRSFLLVIRTFMTHVKHAQRIYRRRKLAKCCIYSAMCIRFDTVNAEMLSDKSVGVYFPPQLRNRVVSKLVQLSADEWALECGQRASQFVQDMEKADKVFSNKVDRPFYENSICLEAAMIVAAKFPVLARNSCVKVLLDGFRQGKKLTPSDKQALRTWISLLYLEIKRFEAMSNVSVVLKPSAAPPKSPKVSGLNAPFTSHTSGKRSQGRSPSELFLTAIPPFPDRRTSFAERSEGEVDLTKTVQQSLENNLRQQQELEQAQLKQAGLQTHGSGGGGHKASPTSSDLSLSMQMGMHQHMLSKSMSVVQSLLREEAKRNVLRRIVTESMAHALSRKRTSNIVPRGARDNRPQLTLKQRLMRSGAGMFPLTDPGDDSFPLFSSLTLPKFSRRKNIVDKRNIQMLMRLTKDAWITASNQTALENLAAGHMIEIEVTAPANGDLGADGTTAEREMRKSIQVHRKASIDDRLTSNRQVYAAFVDEYRRRSTAGVDVAVFSERDVETAGNVDLSFIEGYFRRLR